MSAAQILPEIELEALPARAIDITDQRFGMLTAIRPCSRSKYGIRWICKCDCGRFAVRTASDLRHAVKLGREPQCSECLQELQGGHDGNYYDRAKERFLLRLENDIPLWTEYDVIHLQDQIREEIEEREGFVMEPPLDMALPVTPAVGWNEREDPDRRRRRQDEERRQRELDTPDEPVDPLLQQQLGTMLGRAIVENETTRPKKEPRVVDRVLDESASERQSAAEAQLAENIFAEVKRLKALCTWDDPMMAPWELRVRSSLYRFGASVIHVDRGGEGLVACVHCKRILLGGTLEAKQHADNRCSERTAITLEFSSDSRVTVSFDEDGFIFPVDIGAIMKAVALRVVQDGAFVTRAALAELIGCDHHDSKRPCLNCVSAEVETLRHAPKEISS